MPMDWDWQVPFSRSRHRHPGRRRERVLAHAPPPRLAAAGKSDDQIACVEIVAAKLGAERSDGGEDFRLGFGRERFMQDRGECDGYSGRRVGVGNIEPGLPVGELGFERGRHEGAQTGASDFVEFRLDFLRLGGAPGVGEGSARYG